MAPQIECAAISSTVSRASGSAGPRRVRPDLVSRGPGVCEFVVDVMTVIYSLSVDKVVIEQ